MSWKVKYLREADEDYQRLDNSQRILVDKAIEKIRKNPLPQREGGYGKELANRAGRNLSGLLKVKLKANGIRIVYKLIRTETAMLIVVIGMRADDEVYQIAQKRRDRLIIGEKSN